MLTYSVHCTIQAKHYNRTVYRLPSNVQYYINYTGLYLYRIIPMFITVDRIDWAVSIHTLLDNMFI